MLKKHVYVYSPSGAVRDKLAFSRGIRRLEAAGYQVEVDTDALTCHTRFAGDDDIRLASIHRASASGADLALISRGGYGLTRILDRIQYKAVAKSIMRGTTFLGLSDFTSFQLALLTKTGAVSWAGPALCEGFGSKSGADDIMLDCFNDLMMGQGEGAGWRQHKEVSDLKSGSETQVWECSNAVLWGGNLSLMCSLVGTPYFPDIRGGVLFLEDVAEQPYRIERMLTQLLHAGVLARQKAIVLGQFTDFQLTSHDRGFNLKAVISWLRNEVRIPVLTNLPFGHIPTKILLPVGARVKLHIEGRDALLFWGHRYA